MGTPDHYNPSYLAPKVTCTFSVFFWVALSKIPLPSFHSSTPIRISSIPRPLLLCIIGHLGKQFAKRMQYVKDWTQIELGKLGLMGQRLSNFNAHTNPMGILLTFRLWFSRWEGWDLRTCISSRLPDGAHSAGPWATHLAASTQSTQIRDPKGQRIPSKVTPLVSIVLGLELSSCDSQVQWDCSMWKVCHLPKLGCVSLTWVICWLKLNQSYHPERSSPKVKLTRYFQLQNLKPRPPVFSFFNVLINICQSMETFFKRTRSFWKLIFKLPWPMIHAGSKKKRNINIWTSSEKFWTPNLQSL